MAPTEVLDASGLDLCLHELIEAQTKQMGDAIAVADERRSLSYRQLNARANQVARYLRKLGVGPEILVGVAVDRSVELLVALLGIMKAGGAYVPLDLDYPRERTQFMMEDSGLRFVLTQASLQQKLPDFQGTCVCLDLEGDSISGESEEDFSSGTKPDNLVYVIYTSGSTGLPKGVQIEHHSLVNLVQSLRVRPGFTAQDTFLALSTISFDMSKPELFLPLITGGRVFVARRSVVNDVDQFEKCLAQSGANILLGPPSLWRLLIESGWAGKKNCRIMCGGEALGAPLASELLKRCSSLWNWYGPTETTVLVTMFQVVSADAPILIGTPIRNTRIYILDSHQKLVPVGEPGELFVGGAGLARGYLNRPELTSEKFVADPFSRGAGGRLYRTGDLARFLPDGNIEFLGRVDNQVQIRGYRVETGEVEAALGGHEAVEAVAVVGQEMPAGGTLLLAYLVVRTGKVVTSDELRGYLRRKLPEYMIPARFEFLSELPMTPSGKLDRMALPGPGSSRGTPAEERLEPQTDLERALERIFAEVLELDWVGADEDFFDLGGDSLRAIDLTSRVAKLVGQRLSLASLLRAPSVRELAAFLSDDRHGDVDLRPLPIQPLGSRPPFFCVGGGPATRTLGRLLTREQPFLGLVIEEDEIQTLPTPYRVGDLAAILIRKMQTRQPAGPYFVGGWCFHADIAYEMAQQLQAKGEKVGLLVVMELKAHPLEGASVARGLSAGIPRIRHRVRYILNGVRESGWSYIAKGLSKHLERWRDALRFRARLILYKLYCATGLRLSKWMRRWQSIETFSGFYYRPKPYLGRMALVRSEPQAFTPYPEENDWGWSALVMGRLDIHFVPFAAKAQVFQEPNAELLAKKLREILIEVQEPLADVGSPFQQQAAAKGVVFQQDSRDGQN